MHIYLVILQGTQERNMKKTVVLALLAAIAISAWLEASLHTYGKNRSDLEFARAQQLLPE